MGNHKGWVAEEFTLNGHSGYRFYNETTGTHSILCSTCHDPTTSFPTRPTLIDEWHATSRRRHYPTPLAWERHADPLNHPVAGQRYEWEGLAYVVVRVSEKHRWAVIRVTGQDGWTKKQPLPLPPGSVRAPVVKAGATL